MGARRAGGCASRRGEARTRSAKAKTKTSSDEAIAINSSWLDTPDPAEAFEPVKAKARWAEDHGFGWFSVLDHMIQIPRVGAPDEPVFEGWIDGTT